MNEVIDWASTEKARLMGLDYVPKTPIATAFCDALGDVLGAMECRKNQRRGNRKQTFNRAAGAAAADLLKAAVIHPRRWSYRLLTTASFTGGLVSYVDFKSVLAAAERGHLLEKLPGHYQRYDFGDGILAGAGKATRFRALPKLMELAANHGLTPGNVDDHFQRQTPDLPLKPLVLKASTKRMGYRKVKGSDLRFEGTPETARMERDIAELNEFMSRCQIDGAIHRGYRRIFNEGDKLPYRWDKGGRLYSAGEDSYQTLKKARRLKMMLDGEPVAEIDIRASYLTLVHGLRGVPFNAEARDPYEVEGLPRAVVKAWVTMTIGHTRFHRRWPPSTSETLRENGEESIDTKKYPLKRVQPLILERLPILKNWPDLPLSGFDLMYKESEAVIGTMLELMRMHQVPSLSVHDSVIVPVSRFAHACSILERRYKEVSGVKPFLNVRTAPGIYAAAWF
jgi:hypothetical protein